jgi:hypothetical protein
MFDYKCRKCGKITERIVPVDPDSRPEVICECGDVCDRQFPNQMTFELKNTKTSVCGWSYDGYTSRVPTHEIFNEDGSYKEKYQKKHDAGGTPIFDGIKGV